MRRRALLSGAAWPGRERARTAAASARGRWRTRCRRWWPRSDGNLVSDAGKGQPVCGAEQGADSNFRPARQAQRVNRTGLRSSSHDHLFHGEYISDGGRGEDTATIPSGPSRVVGRSGWTDSFHDRRTGAVRCIQGVSRTGAETFDLQPGNGGRSALVAVRGHQSRVDRHVSRRRNTDASPGIKYERARVASAKGSYDDANVPYIDYNLTIAGTQKPKRNQNQFLGDPSAGGFVNVGIVNIIQRRSGHAEAGAARRSRPLSSDRARSVVHSRRAERISDWRRPAFRRESRRHRVRTCADLASPTPRGDAGWRPGWRSWVTRIHTSIRPPAEPLNSRPIGPSTCTEVEGQNGRTRGIPCETEVRRDCRCRFSGGSLPSAGARACHGAARRSWCCEQGSRALPSSLAILHLHKSTIHRLLKVLEGYRFVRRNPQGKYDLGPEAFRAGEHVGLAIQPPAARRAFPEGRRQGNGGNRSDLRVEQHTDDLDCQRGRAMAAACDRPSRRTALISVWKGVPGVPPAPAQDLLLSRLTLTKFTRNTITTLAGLESRVGAGPPPGLCRQQRRG